MLRNNVPKLFAAIMYSSKNSLRVYAKLSF